MLLYLASVAAQVPNDAEQAFQQGYYEEAILQWQKFVATEPISAEHLAIWLKLAQAYRRLGSYEKALETLNLAIPVARKINTATTYYALLVNELSKVRLSQGSKWHQEALQQAQQALTIAKTTPQPILIATILNHHSNLLTVLDDYEEALKMYHEALTTLKSSPLTPEVIELHDKILLNEAKTHFLLENEFAYQFENEMEAFKNSTATLREAWQAIQKWQDSYNKVLALITASQLAQQIQAQLSQPIPRLNDQIYDSLITAIDVAERLGHPTAKAYAQGYLGKFYETTNRYKEALAFTRQAIFFAQQNREQLMLYQWHWQLGRILKAQGNPLDAIIAYQQAINYLNPIRFQVATTGYVTLVENFRQQIAPIYFELADLLLQQASSSETKIRDQWLQQAQDTIEAFKQAELQDYFKSECVNMRTACSPLAEALDEHTAILYPIPLPNRLELLLHLPQGIIRQFTVPVTAGKLQDQISSLLSALRRHPLQVGTSRAIDRHSFSTPLPAQQPQLALTLAFSKPAQTLYQWLIEPLTKQLVNIDTLIIIPEGNLRTIPFTALYDGKQFLVEKYALAISPGLCLNAAKTFLTEKKTVLLGGLSEAVQGFSPLPYTQYELNNIHQLIKSPEPPLLDNNFTIDQLQKQIERTSYSIVHLASHGQFSANLEKTFILTHDQKLSMDKLEQLMSLKTFQNKPVELLILSACETAVGDDRAALGLAGVALKAGVRSALASLWRVDDEATPMITMEFYRQLQQPGMSKAKALQNSQKKMIASDHPYHSHPYFWSAFLLIGNWF